MSHSFKINIPKVIQLSNIEDLVQKFSPVFDVCNKNQEFVIDIDLSDLNFITPTGLSTLRAVIMYIAQSKYKTSGKISVPKSSMQGYLTRMNFYDFLKEPIKYQGNKYNSKGRFCELIEVASEKASDQVADDLAKILQKQLSLSHQAYFSIQHTLSEVIINVFHHAHSPVNAIVSAQTYTNLRKLEISIVDCGDGFRVSMLENSIHAKVNTIIDALSLAIKPKVTGRPGHNAGEGLFFTSELVKQNQGEMIIYSEDGLLNIQGNNLSSKNVPYWKGAIVSICLNLDNTMDVVSLFNKYAPKENGYDLLTDIME